LPTTAVIWVAELTVKLWAATVPNLTAVAPVKLVPVMIIEVPVPPEVGVKPVITGGWIKVKLLLELPVPLGVVTLITPVAPLATTAVIWVLELTVKLWAAVFPNLTAPAPVKFAPVITTDAPAAAEAGVNDVTVGAGAAF
jgi:hypothetical protein